MIGLQLAWSDNLFGACTEQCQWTIAHCKGYGQGLYIMQMTAEAKLDVAEPAHTPSHCCR